jgi:hypothetical protein
MELGLGRFCDARLAQAGFLSLQRYVSHGGAGVSARLGGWTGYYGKPGPIVMLRGLTRFHDIKHGTTLQDV